MRKSIANRHWLLSAGVLLGMALLPSSFAFATKLTFDISPWPGNFNGVHQAYGDNVTSAVMGSYSYGNELGFTPNVVVEYASVFLSDPSLWDTGYGDLTNILFKDTDDYPTMQVIMTADPGYAVHLGGFDMSTYTTSFGSDPTINYVRVLDASNNELFRQNNPSISRTSHTSFVFGTPLVSNKLTVEFDSINLGNSSDDIAIDNIAFGQVPEPTTLSLLALGGLALLCWRRKQSTADC